MSTYTVAVAAAVPIAAGIIWSSGSKAVSNETSDIQKTEPRTIEPEPVVEQQPIVVEMQEEETVKEELIPGKQQGQQEERQQEDAKKSKKAKKKKAKKANKKKKAKKSMIDMLGSPTKEAMKTKKVAPITKPPPAITMNATEEENNRIEVPIAANRIGALMGEKGITLKIVQDITSTTIDVPDRDAAEVVVIGIHGEDMAGAERAARIVRDLANKGYCTLLEDPDFVESSVKVPIGQVHEVIGKGGRVIKAIQDSLGVRLNVPDTSNTGRKKVLKVGIAGAKAAVEEARATVRSIVQIGYSEVTHPGMTHAQVEVPAELYSVVIGPRGSTIKHLQNSYEVKVNIPRGTDSGDKEARVVVVGPASGVKFAKQEIEKIVHRTLHENDYAEVETDSYGDEEEEAYEPWMNEFSPPRRQVSGATWA